MATGRGEGHGEERRVGHSLDCAAEVARTSRGASGIIEEETGLTDSVGSRLRSKLRENP